MPLPAAWLGEGNDTLFLNASFCKFSGAPEEISKEEFIKLVYSADAANLKELLEKEPAEERKLYFRIKTLEGQFRWHCHCWKPTLEKNQLKGAINLFQDIHDFYQPNPKSENRLQKIFDESLQFTALVDREGCILEVNKTALDFGGYELEKVRGHHFWKAGWWKNTAGTQERLQKAVHEALNGNIFRSEETITGVENQELVIDFSLKPLLGANGEIEHLIAEGRDMSDMDRVQNRLKNSENLWRTLVENTPDIIVRHNTSLVYTYINPSIEQLTGHPPSHYIGKLPEEVGFPPSQFLPYSQTLQKVLQDKKKANYTTEIEGEGNSKYSLFITVTPELNDKGEVLSLLVTTRNVTALKEKEKELAKANKELSISGAKLRNILDSTKDLISARDSNFRLLAFNKAFKKDFVDLWGRKPRIGESIEEQFAHFPNERDGALALWKRALQGEEYSAYHEFGAGTGAGKYYEINFSTILNQEGNIVGATSIARDLTRERSIEKELKDAREFLILAENLPHIVFTTGPNGIPDYLNQAFYEYTGSGQVDFRKSFVQEFVHPNDRQALHMAWKDAVEKHEGLQQEVRIRYKTGEYRWNLIRFFPMVNPKKNLAKWIGSVTDIHEGKTAEEQQRMAAREFRQLSESLPQIIWTAYPDGAFNYLNDKWYEYTGESQIKAYGMGWLEFVHPDDQEMAAQKWNESIKNEEEFLVEYRLQNMLGQYRWFLGKALPLRNSDDEIIKWFGSATEIHDQKLQNKRLSLQNMQLNQINQYLDNFVHTAAHDLRAPIVNIKGLLGLLEDTSEDKKEQIIHNLKISVDRLDSTLQGMILLIEAQSHSGDLSRNINVREVFYKVFAEFKEELLDIDYELVTDFAHSYELNFVLPYLTSTFRNLISNSIKYRKKEEKLLLFVKCRQQEDFLFLTYQDNGIGIDMTRFEKNLFRPFRRFTSQSSGKGIGLHIVKNMLVKTGGNIKVESELGKGTTFKLYLKNQPETRDGTILFPDEL